MSISKSNLVLGLAVALVAVAFGVWKFRPAPETAPAAPVVDESEQARGMQSEDEGYVPPDDPVLMNKVFDFEAKLAAIDQEVWPGETMSHRYGDVFNTLWDELRHEKSPQRTLGSFEFGELVVGSPVSTNISEHGIESVSTTGSDPRVLLPEQWRSLLREWSGQGYELVGSEWRHPKFDPPTETSPAKSTIQITWLVTNDDRKERLTIRGDLKVTWSESAQFGDPPVPVAIDATELEIIRRHGQPMFERVKEEVVMPFDNSIFIEPLMAYDLDGDGLVEYMLGCRNQVYWNRGGGEFELGTLCRFRPERPFVTSLADFDGDGHVDLLAADSLGLELFRGDGSGPFDSPADAVWDAPEPMGNPYCIASGDVDRDGDLDVWLLQYKIPYTTGQMPSPYYDANDGFPAYLLLNNGNGTFVDGTVGSGLEGKRHRRAYSASFFDLDEDGDLDFLQVSDFAGVDLFLNNGDGTFTDITSSRVANPRVMGMGHSIGDFDLDGQIDFYAIGMGSYSAQRMDHLGEGPKDRPEHNRMRSATTYGSRMFFNRDGKFVQTALSDQVAQTGWSWGVASADFDNDLDLDLVVNNGQLSREFVKDYETQFWRHDIYVATSEPDEVLDVFFNMTQTRLFGEGWSYGGNEFNKFFLSENGEGFRSVEHQVGLALTEDLRAVVAEDFDNDGLVDVLYQGFSPWPDMESAIYLHMNRWPDAGNWIGFRMQEEGGGFSPVGARLNLTLEDGRVRKRMLVTGDSYRSQSAPVAHFGVADATSVKQVEIIWANGTKKIIPAPEINRYHVILGRE